MVAAGILLSRILGLIRNRVFAHYFGTSDVADSFNAAFRIPNFLQNLFGEGVLSASFIPVYAGLRAKGDDRIASEVAGAVAVLLGLVVSVLVLAGMLLSPVLIDLIAPGFEGEKRAATIRLVRILFPGAGLLVLSAWCLGVLNSHRRFFLSYSAPVVWNLAIIAVLLGFGDRYSGYSLAEIAAWGSVAGSLLQFAIQLPAVLRLLGGFRAGRILSEPVRLVARNFGPVFVGRGVAQISAYIDTLLASLLPTGAVAALSYAQVLYTLPVSLFGMSVSAAELPAMSSAAGDEERRTAYLRERLSRGLRQIAYFVVPSAMAFLALGDVVVGALYQSGEFTRPMTVYVWGILAGSAVGLLASTLGRLYASTFYALHDTRTPLRVALVRVGTRHNAGIPLCSASAAGAWARRSVGRRGHHCGGRPRGMDRVSPAAAQVESSDRGHRTPSGVRLSAMGLGNTCRRGCLVAEARDPHSAPCHRGGGPAWGLRVAVSGGDIGAAGGGSQAGGRAMVAATLDDRALALFFMA